MKIYNIYIITALFSVFAVSSSVFAQYPTVTLSCGEDCEATFVDPDGDGVIHVHCIGDSITVGVPVGKRKSYPALLKKIFPKMIVTKTAKAGIQSGSVRVAFQRAFAKRKGRGYRDAKAADYIIVLEGINDYFSPESPGVTLNEIKRLVKIFDRNTSAITFISKLLPNDRPGLESQEIFKDEVNTLIDKLNKKKYFTNFIDFSKMPKSLLIDGLHPSAKGQKRMANLVKKAFVNDLLTYVDGIPDSDGDGIINKHEKFLGTDRTLFDTDGDEVSDPDEIYINLTDPLNGLDF